MSIFNFKQFSILQEKNAMKVNTDSVVLAAWIIPSKDTKTILDIGTGTGLLALCMAQKHPHSAIDAIEIIKENLEEAEYNFTQSIWKKNITPYHSSLQNFTPKNQYDLIICNPPYFIGSSKNPLKNKTTARHTDSLNHEEIIMFSKQHLTRTGELSIVLPYEEGLQFIEMATQNKLFIKGQLLINGNPKKSTNRMCMNFGFKQKKFSSENLTIRNIQNQYTKSYLDLTKDFYLNLKGE